MAHPRHVQSILPQSLQNFEKLKAVSKRILKLYIRHRMENEWTTYTGQVKNLFKSVATKNASDQWRILKDCDIIKKEIENLRTYSDLFSLVEKLNKMSSEAINEEWRVLSSPSLRGPTYFAIISLVNEMMKVQFPNEYAADIAQTLEQLQLHKAAFKSRSDNSMPTEKEDAEIDTALTRLVLLGERSIFTEAFSKNRNLFPQFKRTSSSSNSYVAQSEISLYREWVKAQYLSEPGQGTHLTNYDLPNINVPYPLQPNFAMIYLRNEPDRPNNNTFDEGLEYCANLAIRDRIISPERSFFTQYAVNPKSFDAKNDPSDASEIIAELEAQTAHESYDIDEDPHAQLRMQQELEQAAVIEEAVVVAEEEEEEELIAALDIDNAKTTATAPSNNNVEASNVVPLTPPASPKVSQMGTFAASPAAVREASPEKDMEESASLEADGDTQEEAHTEEGNTQTQPNQSRRRRRR